MRQRSKGFTLIEVMTVVAIVGVMMGLAMFAVAGLTWRAKATTFLEELAMDVPAARMLAARQGKPVVIVFNCDTAYSAMGDNGYAIYREMSPNQVDLDNLSTLPAPSADLQREKFAGMGLCLLADAKPANVVSKFNVGGFPWLSVFTKADAQSKTCTFCSQHGTAWRGALRVLPDGRVFMSGGGNTNGGGVIFARSKSDSAGVNQALAILVPSGMAKLF